MTDPSKPRRHTENKAERRQKENRIILTTNKELLRSKSVTHGILMRPGTTKEQIKYVIDYLDVEDRIKPFSKVRHE